MARAPRDPTIAREYQLLLGDRNRLNKRLDVLRRYADEFRSLSDQLVEVEQAAASIEAAFKHLNPKWKAPTTALYRRKSRWEGLAHGSLTRTALGILRTASKPLSGTELGEMALAKIFPGRVHSRMDVNRAGTTIAGALRRQSYILASGARPILFSLKRP